jgi:hypothetical protein
MFRRVHIFKSVRQVPSRFVLCASSGLGLTLVDTCRKLITSASNICPKYYEGHYIFAFGGDERLILDQVNTNQ